MESILNKLESIEKLLQQQNILKKEVLNTDEAARYLGICKQTLYQMMSKNQIPYYKPQGKLAAFNREELNTWLQRNKQLTGEEIEQSVWSHKLKVRRR